MAKFTQNHTTSSSSSSSTLKWVFLTCCVVLLGAALIADFLWASSSYSSSSYFEKTATLVVPKARVNNAGQVSPKRPFSDTICTYLFYSFVICIVVEIWRKR